MLLVKNRRMAQDDRLVLPKVRLCADVFLSLVFDAETDQVKTTIRRMQSRLGNGWSATSAIQFLSGHQAEVAIGRSLPEERPALYFTHCMAKSICYDGKLGAVSDVDGLDLAKLRSLFLQPVKQGGGAPLPLM